MSIKRNTTLSLVAACLASTVAWSAAPTSTQQSPSTMESIAAFQSINLQSSLAKRENGSIARVYGKAFSHGRTGEISAVNFIDQHASMWGVSADELLAEGPFNDGHNTQQIGYLPEFDSYKFTGFYYKQMKQGLPVYGSKLVLLTRNERNNPLVLASSQLYDLSAINIDAQQMRMATNENRIILAAEKEFNAAAFIIETERMIFAGVNSESHAPTLADISTVEVNGFEKYLVITDAMTGEIIHTEDIICRVDVAGNVSAMASEGIGSDNCEAEVIRPLPYLNVGVIGGNSIFSDINGDFNIPNAGSSSVSVEATYDGKWFNVFDFVTTVESVSTNVTPPALASLTFNASNSSALQRAQANAYVEANIVRDFAIAANPSYPTLNRENFPITVNRNDGFCPGNAWYDPSDNGGNGSINFCSAGSSNPNTAWSSVIHHEYGHHLVNAGGSGQGMYGEGMGDVMSTIILDDNRLGLGFFGSCNGSLRDADNSHQYPCSGSGHDCGQLISGCVWDTRELMVVTEPDDYTEILNFLAVNSILVHSGSEITPQITIDWLTLDDDDANISNGTPHYFEIATGFGAHNMDAPELTLIDIQPVELPEYVNSNGGTSFSAQFTNVSGTLNTSSPTMMVDTGSGFVAVPMTNDGGGQYSVDFPSSNCGSQVSFYVTATTTSGATQNSPADAPTSAFSTISAFSAPVVAFSDNGESNMGWTTSGSASDGQWNRGTPVGGGDRADPASDYDGSGACYLTDNVDDNSDVDGGATILTSPTMDATGSSVISYARWFHNSGNSTIDDIFVVEISDDNGSSWTNLETIGVNHSESNGGWFTKQFDLASIAGFTANNQFQIRFIAEDEGGGSIVEAGVDAIQLQVIDCDACIADLNGDGDLNFFDISAFLVLFGNGDLAADFNGDGSFNFFDISAFLTSFGDGCP